MEDLVQAYSPRSTKADPPVHAVRAGQPPHDATALCGASELEVIDGGGEPYVFDAATTFACERCRGIAARTFTDWGAGQTRFERVAEHLREQRRKNRT